METVTQDVIECFKSAKNFNAAVKNFLKKELRGGDTGERFIKDLRESMLPAPSKRTEIFINARKEQYLPHLLAVGAYAHSDAVGEISQAVVEKYADEFNSTYTKDGDSVVLTNESRFDSIVEEVLVTISEGLQKQELKVSQFMTQVVLNAIFEAPVLQVIFKRFPDLR